MGISCPFVCPICRGQLEWSGACFGCHGTAMPTDRASWSFPGARYETHDEGGKALGDGQHCVKIAEAGRRACTPEENRAGFAEVQRVLTEMMNGIPLGGS